MAHLVHIGLHKTASTWLQRVAFPRLAGVRVLGPPDRLGDALCAHLVHDGDEAFLAAGVRALLDDAAARAGHGVLLTSEGLSGDLYDGSGWPRTLDRLAAVAPAARILVVVRRQPDLARSLWAQYVHDGGTLPLDRFLAGERSGRHAFDPARLSAWPLVDAYRRRFGADAVTVLPYELFGADPSAWLDALATWSGTTWTEPPPVHERANASLRGRQLDRARRWNALVRPSHLNPRPRVRGVPGAETTSRVVLAALARTGGAAGHAARDTADCGDAADGLADRFRRDNAELARATGLDLVRFGYPLPPDPAGPPPAAGAG